MQKKYFFTKEYSSCPLNGLSPDEIKKTYSNELSRGKIGRQKYYKLMSKALGFNDWGDYQKAYSEKIIPFLKENDLTQYAPKNEKNILKSEHGDVNFSYRQVSDRIFLSNNIPEKIFTGYDCKIDNFDYFHGGFSFKIENKIFLSSEKLDKNDLESFIQSDIYLNIKEEHELDYLIPSFSIWQEFKNLLGDTFILNNIKNKKHLNIEYWPKQVLVNQESYKEIGNVIHNQLKKLDKGWIEIIHFNENLVFLKANDGKYDYVFKNMRNESFNAEFGEYIKIKNIPSLINEKHDFDRWLYFGFKDKNKKPKDIHPFNIWLERDEHLAEIEYYKNKPKESYPGIKKILKDYYIKKNKYSYYRKSTNKIIDGYIPLELGNKTLCISNLITLKDYAEFYLTKDENNQNYQKSRFNSLEDLFSVNQENENTPISVTWYDAIAYCRYIENKYNVPTRLLFHDEYEMICPPLVNKEYTHTDININLNYIQNKSYTPSIADIRNELKFFYQDKQLPSPPPYMHDFENVLMKLAKPLEFTENNGLTFCTNERFNEWTNEFRSGHSKFVSAKYYINKNNWVLASSTMKYKYRKVGFRVCYELSKDSK